MAMGGAVDSGITRRPVLASFDTYEGAQKAVDTLSDGHFPVQHVAIVGVDLRLVESVLGRMSWGRAAVNGMATFAWFGVLIGLFVAFFGAADVSASQMILLGLLFGAAFGIVFGLVSYAFTGGRRDFVSRQALQAARYDVLCEAEHIGRARQMLGLGPAWPPPLPETTAGQPPAPHPSQAPHPSPDSHPGPPTPPPGSPPPKSAPTESDSDPGSDPASASPEATVPPSDREIAP